MLNTWQYYLTTEDGKYYYVQPTGEVALSDTERPLKHTPSGWQDLLIGWERDLAKIGLSKKFTFPLGFVFEGARILRQLYYSGTVDTVVYLVIRKLLTTKDDLYFYQNYADFGGAKLELDLTTFKDEETKVTVSVEEGKVAKLLKANSATKYEYPLEDSEAVSIKLDGVLLTQTDTFLMATIGAIGGDFMPFIAQVAKEGQTAGVAAFTQPHLYPLPDFTTSPDYFYQTSQDITGLHLKGSFLVQGGGNGMVLQLCTSLGRTIALNDPLTINTATTVVVDKFFDGSAGENFFFVVHTNNGPTALITFQEAQFTIQANSTYKATTVKGFPADVLLRKIITKITGDATAFTSTLIYQNRNQIFTCGNGVRGLAGSAIVISLDDFFAHFHAVNGAGMSIENGKIVIENYGYYFDGSSPIYLGDAKGLSISPATDLMGNTIKVGYNPQTIDDVNGKYAFNYSQTYGSPLLKEVKELDFISPFITDPYVIELTRINLDGKLTTDNKQDNEVMVLDCEQDTGGATTELFKAVAANSQFFASGDAMYFDTATGPHFTMSGDGKTFTYTGASQTLTLNFPTTIYATPTTYVQQKIYINGVLAGQNAIQSTGNYAASGHLTTFLTTGDVITFKLFIATPTTTEGQVMNAEFSVEFTDVTIAAGWHLFRETYEEAFGVPDFASIFNIRFSPKRVLNTHGVYLNSIYNNMSGLNMSFLTADQNRYLYTKKGSDVVDEDASKSIDNTQYFKPHYFDFNCKVPFNLVALLDSNTNRCFSFRWNYQLFKGFLIKGGIAPDDNKEQAFKLLCCADVDIKNINA